MSTAEEEATFAVGDLVRHRWGSRAATVVGYERDGDGTMHYLVRHEGQDGHYAMYAWELRSEADYAQDRAKRF